jgi:hypothetical protein
MCDVSEVFLFGLLSVVISNMTKELSIYPSSHTICIYTCLPVKPNGIIITEELREELNQAAMATTQAYVGARNASAGMVLTFFFIILCKLYVKSKSTLCLLDSTHFYD